MRQGEDVSDPSSRPGSRFRPWSRHGQASADAQRAARQGWRRRGISCPGGRGSGPLKPLAFHSRREARTPDRHERRPRSAQQRSRRRSAVSCSSRWSPRTLDGDARSLDHGLADQDLEALLTEHPGSRGLVERQDQRRRLIDAIMRQRRAADRRDGTAAAARTGRPLSARGPIVSLTAGRRYRHPGARIGTLVREFGATEQKNLNIWPSLPIGVRSFTESGLTAVPMAQKWPIEPHAPVRTTQAGVTWMSKRCTRTGCSVPPEMGRSHLLYL